MTLTWLCQSGDLKCLLQVKRRQVGGGGGEGAEEGETGGREWRGEGRTPGRGGRWEGRLPSVILSSEGEERMRKQEIRFKGRMKRGGN